MSQEPTFGVLFADLAERRGLKPTPLMREANRVGEELDSYRWVDLSIDQIKGWQRKESTGTTNWLQLVVVLSVLEASASQVEGLLDAATEEWSLAKLRAEAKNEPAILAVLAFDTEPDIPTEPDTSTELADSRLWFRRSMAGVAVLIVVVSAVAFIAPSNEDPDAAVDTSRGSTAPTSGNTDPGGPAQTTISVPFSTDPAFVGSTCEFELADLTPENIFESNYLETPGCEGIESTVQYRSVPTNDLRPWPEAVTECWSGGGLIKLWLRVNHPSHTKPSWLGLGPNTWFEDKGPTTKFELYSAPSADAISLGEFSYEEIQSRIDALRFDLLAVFDSETKMQSKDAYHLGGCWKGEPRTEGNGAHFYLDG